MFLRLVFLLAHTAHVVWVHVSEHVIYFQHFRSCYEQSAGLEAGHLIMVIVPVSMNLLLTFNLFFPSSSIVFLTNVFVLSLIARFIFVLLLVMSFLFIVPFYPLSHKVMKHSHPFFCFVPS